MGLEQVKQEIISRAKQEEARIILEAEKEAQAIDKETEEKVGKYRKEVEEKTKEMLVMLDGRETAAAEFDVKKNLLDKKKEIIDRVFEQVSESLKKLSDKKRQEYIKRLVDKAKKEINVKYVYASPKDKKFVSRIRGVEYKPKEILGGIIAETADRKISIDYSFEEMLREIKEKHLQEIGKLLF
jgi:V/A-type H+-transporting ATPase subunit E